MHVFRFSGWIIFTLVIFVVMAWLWWFVLDTAASRRMISWRVSRIQQQAIASPRDPRYPRKLLNIVRTGNSFSATTATTALGRIGEAAAPFVVDIAELMGSSDPYVSREAALALSRLGPISTPVLPILEEKVRTNNPPDDSTWFAAEAIGNIGEPAIRCLPLLRSKLGTGAVQFDDCLQQAIQRLEELQNDLENNVKGKR